MNARRSVVVACWCISLILCGTGCYTLSTLNVRNGTSSKLKVKSSQTGEEIEIAPGNSGKLPHAAGDIVVSTESDGQFRFPAIDPPALDAAGSKYLKKSKSIFGPGYLTLNLLLTTNMQLYALAPGTKTLDPNVEQPSGYPKFGERLGSP
jgi:hypothetical protein